MKLDPRTWYFIRGCIGYLLILASLTALALWLLPVPQGQARLREDARHKHQQSEILRKVRIAGSR